MLVVLKKVTFYFLLLVAVVSCKQKKDKEFSSLSITEINPRGGIAGDTITLTGSGFPSDIKDVIVKLGEQSPDGEEKAIDLPVIAVSPTEIKVILPEESNVTGLISVTVNQIKVFSPQSFFGGKIVLDENITTDTRLTAFNELTGKANQYLLIGRVYVKDTAILSIEPGTVIFGDKATGATLIIERTAQISAKGTPTQPIVFTSSQSPGSRAPGDWGGIILCGQGLPGVATPFSEFGLPNVRGLPEIIKYGAGQDIITRPFPDNDPRVLAANPQDNSGVLKYVRIEYAGASLVPGFPLSGLGLYRIGKSTTIEHIQISYCAGDAYSWYGGNVNARYLVSLGNIDDDFVTSEGFLGFVQFGLALRDPNFSDISQSNGLDLSDNIPNRTAINSFIPATQFGVFSNITYIGAENLARGIGEEPAMPPGSLFGRGAVFRKNTQQSIYNSVFVGAHLAGISFAANRVNQANETPYTYLEDLTNGIQLKGNVVLATYPAQYPFRGGGLGIEATFDGRPNTFFDPPKWEQVSAAFPLPEILNKFLMDGNIMEDQLPGGPATGQARVQALLDYYGLSGVSHINKLKNPDLLLPASSPLNTGAVFTQKANSIELNTQVQFRGAFGNNDNWAEKWTNFDPQNQVY